MEKVDNINALKIDNLEINLSFSLVIIETKTCK